MPVKSSKLFHSQRKCKTRFNLAFRRYRPERQQNLNFLKISLKSVQNFRIILLTNGQTDKQTNPVGGGNNVL